MREGAVRRDRRPYWAQEISRRHGGVDSASHGLNFALTLAYTNGGRRTGIVTPTSRGGDVYDDGGAQGALSLHVRRGAGVGRAAAGGRGPQWNAGVLARGDLPG